MKKNYVKPAIVFDSFALSKNIAGSCTYEMNFDQSSCVLEVTMYGRTYNIFDNAPCIPAPGVKDTLCYDNPADGRNIFTS